MSGYVRIHRSLIGHPAFRNDAEAMAFAWMVMRAAWKPCRVRYKGHGLSLQRGQLAVSQRDMAFDLDRDKAWIERLWKRLKSEAMIKVEVEAGVAVITICNYANYQGSEQRREAADEARDEAGARQTQGTEQIREEEKKEAIASCLRIAFPPPEGVTGEQWAAFRKQRRKPLNDRSYLLLTNKLAKLAAAGHAAGDLIDLAIERGWETVFPPRSGDKPTYVSASGYEYRSSDPAEVMREAERRGDNNTYWQAKGDRAGRTASIGALTNDVLKQTRAA